MAVLAHASLVVRNKSKPPLPLHYPPQSFVSSSYLFRTVLGIQARHPNQMRMRRDKHVTSRTVKQRNGNTCVTITWSSAYLRVRCITFTCILQKVQQISRKHERRHIIICAESYLVHHSHFSWISEIYKITSSPFNCCKTQTKYQSC
jgi:hypothetical protein